MVVFGGACEKASSTAPDLSTPAGAARCQVAAIAAKDVERWVPCWHPAFASKVKKELAREVSEQADFWQHAKTSAAPLAKVTDAQFTTKAVPADKASFGDQSAQFQLDRDSFEVVRLKGRWYIVDSGI